jgi:octaprenyl-diphosphate synthase
MVSDGSLTVLDILSRTSAIITEGELKQLSLSYNLAITRDQYLNIIQDKTASLFAAACRIGAVITDSSKETEQLLNDIGFALGTIYQMIDDSLDYIPISDRLWGKATGDDFREGKVTLPIIYLYTQASHQERTFIEELFNHMAYADENLAAILDYIAKYQIMDIIRLEIDAVTAKLRNMLNFFSPSADRDVFLNLLDFVAARLYYHK